jgi:hypothetical protein
MKATLTTMKPARKRAEKKGKGKEPAQNAVSKATNKKFMDKVRKILRLKSGSGT